MNQKIITIDLDGVNCYLVKEEDRFFLFDTGGHLMMDKVYMNRREKLLDNLEREGCNKNNLKLIILTHGDSDHTENASFLAKHFQARIAMHAGDLDLVSKPTLEMMMLSYQYRSPVFRMVFKIMKKQIMKITTKVLEDYEAFTPDIFLKDGDNLDQYGLHAKVIHLPGHTNGSIGIMMEEEDMITGDILIYQKKPQTAPNALDFRKLYESIDKIRTLGIKTIYPGHGKVFEMKNPQIFHKITVNKTNSI